MRASTPAPIVGTQPDRRRRSLGRRHPRHRRRRGDRRLRRRRGRARGTRRSAPPSRCASRWKPGPACRDLNDARAALRANPRTAARAARPRRRRRGARRRRHADAAHLCLALPDARLDRPVLLASPTVRPDGMTVWSGTQNPHHAARRPRPAARPAARSRSPSIAWRRPAATAATAPTTSGPTRRCCRAPSAGRCGCSSRASRSTPGSRRAPPSSWTSAAASTPRATRPPTTSRPAIRPTARPTLALLLTGQVPARGRRRRCRRPHRHPALRLPDMPGSSCTTWRRSRAPPGCAACRRCPTPSRTNPSSTSSPPRPASTRSNTGCATCRDPRAADLLKATAERAGWEPRTAPRMRRDADGTAARPRLRLCRLCARQVPRHRRRLVGLGGRCRGRSAPAARSSVERVVVGQDSGLMINPDGVAPPDPRQRHPVDQPRAEGGGALRRDGGHQPRLGRLPDPDLSRTAGHRVVLMPRPDEPPLGAGESASVPSAAAIANAIFDATGVRFRELPFTPERIRAGLARRRRGLARVARSQAAPQPGAPPLLGAARRRWPALAVAALPVPRPRSSRCPRPDPGLYSAGHHRPGPPARRARRLRGLPHRAGRRGLRRRATGSRRRSAPSSPPNITPDPTTGIGAWSYAAFERAMREGVNRDGHHLYPAFPYTAFSRITERRPAGALRLPDEPAAGRARRAPPNALRFPFNLRPLLAGWNALFHRAAARSTPDPARSAEWNRGAYLVDGLGHCGACHTPRNAARRRARRRGLSRGRRRRGLGARRR